MNKFYALKIVIFNCKRIQGLTKSSALLPSEEMDGEEEMEGSLTCEKNPLSWREDVWMVLPAKQNQYYTSI